MIRVGINGFGRIGRVLTRICLGEPDVQVVAINELDPDVVNLAYLLKYDSLYGRLDQSIATDGASIVVGDRVIPVYHSSYSGAVPWRDHQVDVVIEATGVSTNADAAHDIVTMGQVSKVVITNTHRNVDATIIMGVNESSYQQDLHHVLSSSICDANAVAPVLHEIDRRWGIESAFITTLHPWLSYQNLLDGPLSSVASPGHAWQDFSLGRASVMNLIPKDTTAGIATCTVLPHLAGAIEAISFRVPTHIVSASDISICVRCATTADEVNLVFAEAERARPNVVRLEREPLVSSDYLRMRQSCIVDARRTKVIGGRMLKVVTWYDNEWGYSNRVLDVARLACAARRMPK